MRRKLLIVCMATALSGCTVGPNYKRPRRTGSAAVPRRRTPARTASLGDVKWFDLFQDDTLRGLIQRGAASELRHPHRRAAGAAGAKVN